MLQEGALMGEGKVEGQVARILPVAHLPQEVCCALGPFRGMHALPGLPSLDLCKIENRSQSLAVRRARHSASL